MIRTDLKSAGILLGWLVLFMLPHELAAVDNTSFVNNDQSDVGIGIASVESCGRYRMRRGHNRIAGGRPSQLGMFPSYLQITSSPSGFACGGTILGPQHIITAAHCVHGQRSLQASAGVDGVLGAIRGTERMYTSRRVCIHPRWDPRRALAGFDMAVVKLDSPITFNDHVQSACLPTEPLKMNARAFAAGMGWTRQYVPSLRLLYLSVQRIPCDFFSRHPSKICFRSSDQRVGQSGKVCQGDSGGPVYEIRNGRHILYGIVSYGPEECLPRAWSTVFTDVFNLSSDIRTLVRRCQ